MIILIWAARVLAAALMAQTLYFKFTAAPESVEIFTRVGMEPWGRIGVGLLELVSSILILVPLLSWLGAALALSLMVGAIGIHLTVLGVEVQGDGGQLFYYALTVAACAILILWHSRGQIQAVLKRFFNS